MAITRYAVFAGHYYYPACGWMDHVRSFTTYDEAKAHIDETIDPPELNGWCSWDWFQIVDLETETMRHFDVEEYRKERNV